MRRPAEALMSGGVVYSRGSKYPMKMRKTSCPCVMVYDLREYGVAYVGITRDRGKPNETEMAMGGYTSTLSRYEEINKNENPREMHV